MKGCNGQLCMYVNDFVWGAIKAKYYADKPKTIAHMTANRSEAIIATVQYPKLDPIE